MHAPIPASVVVLVILHVVARLVGAVGIPAAAAGAATSGVGSGCEHDAVCVCVCVCV